jgi:hypothetical protein
MASLILILELEVTIRCSQYQPVVVLRFSVFCKDHSTTKGT